jgi:glycine/D-amino acid oxidase-like deaminating enzyme
MTNGVGENDRIIIVGGGVSGLSIASTLARCGFRVTVLEAARLGFGASSRNQGWLHSGGIFARENPRLAAMCHSALQATLDFCPECVEPDHEGMYYIFSRRGLPPDDWVRSWQVAGIPAERWSVSDVVDQLPGMDPRQVYDAYRLPDRSIRPDVLLESLTRTAMQAGAEVRTQSPVTQLLRCDGRVQGVVLGSGEVLQGGFFVLAAGTLGLKHLTETTVQPCGEQSEFTRVILKSHLVAIEPVVGQMPFCAVDAGGFNHLPHRTTSIFGANRWRTVNNAADETVERTEIERIWNEIQRFFPEVDRETCTAVRAWSGTTVQAMRCDQVVPGQAPLPALIDHALEAPHFDNLITVHPGRATLWPQLADEVQRHVVTRMGGCSALAAAPVSRCSALDLHSATTSEAATPLTAIPLAHHEY